MATYCLGAHLWHIGPHTLWGGKKKTLKIVRVEWLGEVHANCPGWDSNLDPQYCGQTHELLCHGSALHSVGA